MVVFLNFEKYNLERQIYHCFFLLMHFKVQTVNQISEITQDYISEKVSRETSE